MHAAFDFCAAHGIVLRHRFLLWCQGESDGDHHTAPDVYAEQFCRMYETLRRENIEHCFLIGIGEYNGPAADISYDAIRNAQYALADHRSDLTVVSRSFETMKVRGLMKDAFHYYQAGYNETGRTAGEALRGICRKIISASLIPVSPIRNTPCCPDESAVSSLF